MTPALSVTNRARWVVRSSTNGTGQPVAFSTTSMRQGWAGAATVVNNSQASERKTATLRIGGGLENLAQEICRKRGKTLAGWSASRKRLPGMWGRLTQADCGVKLTARQKAWVAAF